MKKNLSVSFFLLQIILANSQTQKFPANNIQISFSKSFHGSGDLRGILFSVGYGHYFKKRLEISGNISTTIHNGESGLLLLTPQGEVDASVRFVTAGLQANPEIGFAILRLKRHELKFQAGGIFRYQSSSLPDVYSIYFPASTGFPEPVYTFRQFEKQKIFTLGYSSNLSYTFTTGKNLMLGIKAGFQNDTNGDVITHFGLIIGKRFKNN